MPVHDNCSNLGKPKHSQDAPQGRHPQGTGAKPAVLAQKHRLRENLHAASARVGIFNPASIIQPDEDKGDIGSGNIGSSSGSGSPSPSKPTAHQHGPAHHRRKVRDRSFDKVRQRWKFTGTWRLRTFIARRDVDGLCRLRARVRLLNRLGPVVFGPAAFLAGYLSHESFNWLACLPPALWYLGLLVSYLIYGRCVLNVISTNLAHQAKLLARQEQQQPCRSSQLLARIYD